MNDKQGKDRAAGSTGREGGSGGGTGKRPKKPGDAARKMRAMFQGTRPAGEARPAPRGGGTRSAPAE
ncbi:MULTISPECIES: hypothetical protein [Actinomadura]|uniref:Uncharacterized protein n=1 Tax=Actinomadura livida TaxID=79909 RepID=A0A7W7II78_9ACTN|nr:MULTISPECIES: hypothetical protein [Actinomadura]MBB4777567.1 hypothetical protein [Actinomadura catellatispora]TDB88600.1 hypothetical protein E1266_31035 [Actinomadura sp. 7K534]GGU00239.1 hypothetical protein GCM10010208_25090 [Actinomadura livida]